MNRHLRLGALISLLTVPLATAQQADATDRNRIELGRLANGAAVVFVRANSGDWGVEISGGAAPRITQPKPAQIEIFRGETNVQPLAAGYQTVQQLLSREGAQKETGNIVATARVAGESQAAFLVEDEWKVTESVLSLRRKVSVTGAEENAGFLSAIRLVTATTVKWEDADFFVPGLSYGDPANDGSSAAIRTKRFSLREDVLAAPLFGVSLHDGNWAAVLDLAPRGDTTAAESRGGGATIIDERVQFGALGCREEAGGGLELAFWLPGTTTEAGGLGRGRAGAPGAGATGPAGGTAPGYVRGRYHPVKAGFSQRCQVGFRFGEERIVSRDATRCVALGVDEPEAEGEAD